MTNTESSRSDTAVDRGSYAGAPGRTHWTGLVGFAAFLMILLGCFQAIEGLTAIFNDSVYHVRPNGLVVHVDYTVWGWTHLLLGVAIVLAGIGVLSGSVVGRTVGVVLAVISTIVNMVFLTAAPGMALVIIMLDVFVIYALIVHGGEMAN
ncbi:MAG TPA: hypothetical protein VGN28_13935 [Blastococcus sp.]|nr:hypothetical protein [Blastococcus sp.]